MHAPAPHTAGQQYWLGVRMFTPVAISIAAYGLVWGVLAGQAGMSVLEVALMSGLVFAGSSQFVVLEMWTPGSLPIVSIVIAAAIVNLRLLLMSATLRPLLSPLPLPAALGATFFVSDESWAMTMTELGRGKGGIAFYLGVGTLCWFSWMASTLVGRVLGAFIDDPTKYGLDFAFTATFLALLLGMWKGRGDLVPWIVAALVAIVTSQLVAGNWYIIVGGLAGSFAGAVAETLKERRHVA
jgi:predicted branched-subunit amino acid permease